ncbi:S9 family peptidase [Nocardioides gansuensis]|uniref:S9 family peptidase n=1 Tax=Nocardioides gansuensis TaxID=2138300 RepID=A0A2T8FDV7_9ACTN|nr:prolyl oligopeptidase family serine peptidase [Nocardioides gansuensis]PVG83901.1 S9 family peptidase [Nocardioides gansuensis]
MPPDPQRAVRQLLQLPLWTAFDIDGEGRVLAGSDEPGSMQLVELAPDGSRTQLTDLPSPCSGRYVPGRRLVVVQHDQGGDEKHQLSLLDLGEPLGRPATPDDLTPLVADPAHMNPLLDVTATAVVYSTNRRNEVDMDVVVRDLATGDESVVYDEGGYVVGSHVSHDLTRVATTRLTLLPNSTAVSVSGPDGTRDVTDVGEHAWHESLGFTDDDTGVVLASNHDRDHCALVQVTDGAWTTLVEDGDHDVAGWLSPDGRSIAAATRVDGVDKLGIHEADGRLRCRVDVPEDGVVGVVWAADGGRLVVVTSRPTDPGSLHCVDAATGEAMLLVDAREALPADLRDVLSSPRVLRCPTPDGEQVPCFVYPPHPDADPALAGASVVVVHGGPESTAPRSFGPMTQAMCAAGLTVLVPNVRGSTGFGKRWYSLDDVELRLDSVADLAALHAWLPTLGLDQERSVLWGGSYGGYMVLAGLTMQPGLWAAGVDVVGISSLVTFLENTSDYRRAVREREYGTLADHRDFLVAASPITHLDAMRAPLFVIHGANDPRVPLSEAEQIKAALDVKGIECVLKVYGDEGHGLARRPNRLDAYTSALTWVVRQVARD